MSDALRLDENLVCDTCGRFGAYRLETESLCPDCYEKRGACCAEFGGDDLWQSQEDPPRSPPPDEKTS